MSYSSIGKIKKVGGKTIAEDISDIKETSGSTVKTPSKAVAPGVSDAPTKFVGDERDLLGTPKKLSKPLQDPISSIGAKQDDGSFADIGTPEQGVTPDEGVTMLDDDKIYGEPPAEADDFVLGVDELSPDMKSVYDMLTPAEQAQFKAIGENRREAGQERVEEQLTYLKRNKESKAFLEGQQERSDQSRAEGDIQADAASEERIKATVNQLNTLKTNLAYLGTMGRPGVSMARMDHIAKQVTNAEGTYKNLLKVESSLDRARDLGDEDAAAVFSRKLQLLQNDLDDQVNQVVQENLNALNAAEIAGKLDSESAIESLRISLLNDLDEQIVGVTDANIEQRAYLIERYDEIAENQVEFMKNSKTLDAEQSSARGYQVDGNGNAVIDAETGGTIKWLPDSIRDPIMDRDKGIMYQFAYDEAGNVTTTETKILDKPEFSQSIMTQMAGLVASGKISQASLPSQITDSLVFRQALGEADFDTADQSTPWKQNPDTLLWERMGPDGNPEQRQYKPRSDKDGYMGSNVSNDILSGNISEMANEMPYGKGFDVSGRGQCGEWYNDAVGGKNDTRVGDSYESKMNFVDDSITQGQEGMGVVMNLGGDMEEYGHIGVIASGIKQGPNGEVGYDVISSNMHGDEKVSKDFVTEAMIASTGGFIPTNITEERKGVAMGEKSDAASSLSAAERSEVSAYLVRKYGSTFMKSKTDIAVQTVEDAYQMRADGMSIDAIEDAQTESEFSAEMTGDIRDAIEQMTLNLTVSKDDEKDIMQSIDRSLEAGDTVEVQQKLVNFAIGRLPSTQSQGLKGTHESYRFIEDIEDDLEWYYNNKGKTNIFVGTESQIKNKIGKIKNKELQAIATKIQSTLHKYRKSMTGVAFGEKETEEYQKLFPSEAKTENFNMANITAMKEIMEIGRRTQLESVIGAQNYESLFGDAVPGMTDGGGDELTSEDRALLEQWNLVSE